MLRLDPLTLAVSKLANLWPPGILILITKVPPPPKMADRGGILNLFV